MTPRPEEQPAAELSPLRSSEARILLASVQKLGNDVIAMAGDQGRMLRELAEVKESVAGIKSDLKEFKKSAVDDIVRDVSARLEQTMREHQKRLDSMRPKVDSVPLIMDDKLDRRFKDERLAALMEGQADRKQLRFEAYKVAIGVAVTAILGIVVATFTYSAGAAANRAEALRTSHAAGP